MPATIIAQQNLLSQHSKELEEQRQEGKTLISTGSVQDTGGNIIMCLKPAVLVLQKRRIFKIPGIYLILSTRSPVRL